MATRLRVLLGAILAAGIGAITLQAPPVVAASWDKTPSRFYQNSALLNTSDLQCQSIKAAGGALRRISIWSTSANPAYLQIFNVASNSSVTLSTTSPDVVIPVSVNTSTSSAGAFTTEYFADPLTFSNGICVAGTTAWSGGTTVSIGINAAFY